MAVPQEWAEIGQRVREARLAAKLSQEELGRQIGVDRTMISKIEGGTRRVDAVELVRLSRCLDLPLSHFLSERPAVLSRRTRLLEEETTEASRGSFRLEAELISWLRDIRQIRELGLLEVPPIAKYPESIDSDTAARKASGWLRDRLQYGNDPVPSLLTACQRAGLFVAVVDLPGEGASLIDDDLAVAVVSRLGDPGRRRATAAHELAHVVLGDEYSSDLGVHASRAEREAIMDAFAAEFLLPVAAVNAEAGGASRDKLVRLAATYRTSWSLAVRAGVLDHADAMVWLPQTPTRAELLDATGWTPPADLDWIRVPPSFAHAVMEARKRYLVTTARAVELMRGQIDEPDLPPLGEEDLEP